MQDLLRIHTNAVQWEVAAGLPCCDHYVNSAVIIDIGVGLIGCACGLAY